MNESEKNEKQVPARKRNNYLNKIRQFVSADVQCEIETERGTVAVGNIQEVGRDYLTVRRVVERTFTVMEEPSTPEGEESTEEQKKKIPVEYIEVIEFETVLKLTEIVAVSRITKKVTK